MSGFRHLLSGLKVEEHKRQRAAKAPSLGNVVNHPDFRIMQIIAGLSNFYGRNHCIPTQGKILELLRRYTGRVMSRRTLNRHLRALEDSGYVRRIRRHAVDKKQARGWVMRSTCYIPMWRYACRLRDDARRIAKMLKISMKSESSIRVTKMAQYLEHLYRFPYLEACYPQASTP